MDAKTFELDIAAIVFNKPVTLPAHYKQGKLQYQFQSYHNSTHDFHMEVRYVKEMNCRHCFIASCNTFDEAMLNLAIHLMQKASPSTGLEDRTYQVELEQHFVQGERSERTGLPESSMLQRKLLIRVDMVVYINAVKFLYKIFNPDQIEPDVIAATLPIPEFSNEIMARNDEFLDHKAYVAKRVLYSEQVVAASLLAKSMDKRALPELNEAIKTREAQGFHTLIASLNAQLTEALNNYHDLMLDARQLHDTPTQKGIKE